MARKTQNKKTKPVIWIFCEGKTEKLYFDGFKRKGISIKPYHKDSCSSAEKLIHYAKGEVTIKNLNRALKYGLFLMKI